MFFQILAKCIDSYTEKSVLKAENPDEDETIDPRLEAIVDRMFKRCFDDGKYKQVGVDIVVSIWCYSSFLAQWREAILQHNYNENRMETLLLNNNSYWKHNLRGNNNFMPTTSSCLLHIIRPKNTKLLGRMKRKIKLCCSKLSLIFFLILHYFIQSFLLLYSRRLALLWKPED